MDEFFHEQYVRGWKTPTGGTIYNWKVCAAECIYNYRQEVKRRFRQSPFYGESLYVMDVKQIRVEDFEKDEIAFLSKQQDVFLLYKNILPGLRSRFGGKASKLGLSETHKIIQ